MTNDHLDDFIEKLQKENKFFLICIFNNEEDQLGTATSITNIGNWKEPVQFEGASITNKKAVLDYIETEIDHWAKEEESET